jgi:hypothetical protein
MYDGLGDFNKAVFGGSRTTAAFTAMVQDDDSLGIAFRSRSVNELNLGQIETQEEFQQEIVDGLAMQTGRQVNPL